MAASLAKLRIMTIAAGWALASIGSGAHASEATATRHGSVVIKRDSYGVPSIHANDTYSLFYGYGYALAEDRLFQIESTRRSSQGRAAEVFGADYLEKDREVLTNYDPETLRPQLAALKGEHRVALDGMVAGINARIRDVLADPEHLLPKQFKDFGFRPERWTDLDIAMSWLGQLLFRFSDYTSQISNTALLSELTASHGEAEARKIFSSLRWRDDRSAPLTVQIEDQEAGRAGKPGRAFKPVEMSSLLPLSPEAAFAEARQSITLWGGSGPDHTPHSSNTWLVNRSRLVDADAVMISGPQVGDHVPTMIWAASLHGAGLNVTGLTYPGLPYFHFGTNGTIAWGRTALAGSIIDVYQEHLNPANPHEYRFKGKWMPMQKRSVTIKVKDGKPVTLDLYSTVHGPVIAFDEKNRTAYSKRRAWAGREMESMFAYYDEMKAQSFSEWSAIIARKSNNQNQYYADRFGNVGYIQAGRYPIRPKDFEIQLPTPGTGEREWLGFQPAADNARVLNPKRGYIANWNNRPSIDVLNTDTLLWSKLNHVDVITQQLDAKPKLTVAEVWDVNRKASHASEQHSYFVPLLRAAIANQPDGSRVRAIGEVIAGWDGQEDDAARTGRYASPGVAAYYEWMATALTRFYSRDIPKQYLGGCGSERSALNCPWGQPLGAQVMYFALDRGQNGTPIPPFDFLHGVEPAEFIRATLAEADKTLSARYGADTSAWLLETRPKTWSTLSPGDAAPWSSPDEKYVSKPNQKRGSMNAIYVFKNGKVSMCDAAPPGQSGFIAPDGTPDPHYRDQQQLYTSFDCKPRAINAAEVEAATVTRKQLTF